MVPAHKECSLVIKSRYTRHWAIGNREMCTVEVWGSKIGSHCLSLAGLELALLTRLALNSHRFSCLCFLGSGIKVIAPLHPARFIF